MMIIQKLKLINDFISNMGYRYLFFRISYMIKTKLGWQKKVFPVQPNFERFISLQEWRDNLPPFFFYGKNIKGLEVKEEDELLSNFQDIKKGIITFFSKEKINLGKNYDWVTNPITDYRYDITKHWSEIQDLSAEAGDIKFVWEKARFSYLYDIIRYDFHYKDDQSAFVFSEIEDFIDKNPINQGANYKCSQEISLRTLNWIFALYYYKDSENLTEELFNKIIHTIYWQIHHIYKNINFSRISVRNNHAITETLMLYLSGKLLPFLPNVAEWSKKGKAWFEEEIEYQIYEDGTFLQYSMNYHRVVIQLLTWGIQLAKLNNDKFKDGVYQRAEKSLSFLDACMDRKSGKLPNYGSNDGALFFKLTNDDYRVYCSQLDDLRSVLNGTVYYDYDSHFWYGVDKVEQLKPTINEINTFDKGGYYIINEDTIKTFVRCGAYKDRPAQSDNLHLDIWVNGENVLRDAGSYKYNTDKELLSYFLGNEGHNTVSVDGKDQMLKGGRFIWYYWVKKAKALLKKDKDSYLFEGEINAFKHIAPNISHIRTIEKKPNEKSWFIKDRVNNKKNSKIYQYWHINPKYQDVINFDVVDENGEKLLPVIEEKWYSGYYGVKEQSIRYTFMTDTNEIKTKIEI
ncbi:MAG: alginate lyase family protein [Flavobacteriaceae bacterium]|nr:alginate lyase family protein [Flavobacteriaceae bacterium]